MSARRSLAVALAGGLLIVGSLAFGVTPLLVPGVGFAAIGLAAPPLIWLPARHARATRELARSSVLEDEHVVSTITVRAGRLGLAGARLIDPLAGEPIQIRVAPSLTRGRATRVHVEASFRTRGRKELGEPVLHVSDPLGLVEVVRLGGGPSDVLVLPRTQPVTWTRRAGGGPDEAHHDGTLLDALAASEVDGLRPYRPGTPASRIHWAALARGAGLLERRLRAEHESRPLVILDARVEDEPPADEHSTALDAAVRAAASLIFELARRGGCGTLTAGGSRPLEVDERLGGWPAVHARLALVTAQSSPPALTTGRRPAAMLFYVAARACVRPPALLTRSGGVLVLPAGVAAGRWPVVLEVAGCVGYAVAARARHASAVEAGMA